MLFIIMYSNTELCHFVLLIIILFLVITYLVTSCVKETFSSVSHSHHSVHHSRSPIHSNNQKNNYNV